MSVRYRTRIAEHIRMASSQLLKMGKDPMSMRRLAGETGIPYNTVRRYTNEAHDGPNYAVTDIIRHYLNQFYEMPEEGYIYRINTNEDAPAGQLAGVSAA